MTEWTVYILQCADGTLYTGVTSDLEQRILKHEKGTGAKYLRGRAPYELVFSETHPDRSSALKRELQIKSFGRTQKLALSKISPAQAVRQVD
jgi:predicted GIY-YIG superfamily endonuclease